ncbi:hypothetical protein [Sorangium sp. So ce233]|uniref:hypothetical protein n=1 Tax=Sorangium sp. So ce233 TaxID=3133290 RepID=UPI003F648BEC
MNKLASSPRDVGEPIRLSQLPLPGAPSRVARVAVRRRIEKIELDDPASVATPVAFVRCP